MNFKKILPYVILFAILALPVLAGPFDAVKPAFTGMQDLIGSALDGISENPAVWMKVIFIIILSVILYSLAFAGFMKDHKNGRILLSLVVAIAMVAPIPNDVAQAIFNSLGFVATVIIFLPVLGIMVLTYRMTKDSEGRGMYFIAFGLWLVTLTLYINGIGVQFASPVTLAASGYLSVLAIGYLFFYGFKMLIPSTHHDMSVTQAAQGLKGSGYVPGTKEWTERKDKNLEAELAALRIEIPRAIGRLPRIHEVVGHAMAGGRLSERDFHGVQALVDDMLTYLKRVSYYQNGLRNLNPRTLTHFNRDLLAVKELLKIKYKGLISDKDFDDWKAILSTLFSDKGRIGVELGEFLESLATVPAAA